MIDDTLNFLKTTSGLAVAGIVVGAIVTAAGAGYKVGKDIGDSSSAAYKSANEMQLPAIAKQAREGAAMLRTTVAEFSELLKSNAAYQKLRDEHAQLSADSKRTAAALADATAQVTTLKATLRGVMESDQPRRVDLNKSIRLGNLLTLGYTSARPYPILKANSESFLGEVGTVRTIHLSDTKRTCIVRVLETHADHAIVTADCPE
jgi:hypothetical protein